MHLVEEMRSALLRARKERDQPAVEALRAALGAVANAEAVPAEERAVADAPMGERGLGRAEAARLELSEDEVRAVVRREAEELAATAATYRDHDEHAAADELDLRRSALAPFT